MSVTVCIMTRDEEANLPRCLRSLEGLGFRVIVLDSHSTDRTREIAAEWGAEVVEEDWRGYTGQRERVLELAHDEWTLCLDADEWLDDELREAVLARVQAGPEPGVEGYELNRRTRYLGGWIDHCGWTPEWRLRLLRGGTGSIAGTDPHDRIVVQGGVGQLAGRLNHRPYDTIAEHLAKVNRYTDEMAAVRHAKGKDASLVQLLAHPLGRFLRMYVLRAGFLDGWRGFVVSAIGSFYVFLKYAKLRDLARRGRAQGGDGGDSGG